ncbi:unnamed protein product [Staurois parvus]|uniref:Uncharacterized protein n=1 Tax=Staurois parvus TaxID=386267 RepID=A0ABN9EVJ0_9NEOB|nr:unnamed protein product [Staurois parvus]
MISVAPEVPPVSAHQCHVPVPINATYQCIPVHSNATYQCPSELPFNVTLSAAYHCQSVLPISAIYQCCLSVPISDACQYPSVPPTSASSSVPPISVHQCSLSVPITAASLAHISEGEKSLFYKIV